MGLAVAGANVVFLVVPSGFIRSIIKTASPHLARNAVCVDVSKGMDSNSLCLTTDVLHELLSKNKIATISGPAIAKQMVLGGFTAMNVASANSQAVALVKKVLENKNLKLISTNDIAGVEMSGSFKNVYAVGLGICDGLGLPTNTKAVLLCEALREMSMVIQKMGGKAGTVYGLAGLGDLVGTGVAESSRNRRLGELLGRGETAADALAKVGQVAEGVPAAAILSALAKKLKIKIPLASMVQKIISGRAQSRRSMEVFLKNLR